MKNQIISISPIVLKVPGRKVDLEVKITAPVIGDKLPVVLFSHGHGRSNFLSSYRGYAPLVDFYAAQGFVVVQPTHQDSKTLNLDANGPEGALFWRSRAEDMKVIIDLIDEILAVIPGLSARVNKNHLAAVGHSLGGHTVSMLAGMSVIDPISKQEISLEEPRVKAFVVIGAPGNGADAGAGALETYPVIGGTDFSKMEREVLVVAGDGDKNAFFSEKEDWRKDAYNMSPGKKYLLTVFQSGHMLGGISGYDVAETDDENPQRVSFVREMTVAYLRTSLIAEDKSWEKAIDDLVDNEKAMGRIERKLV
ncbi:MAG: alpha/beta fold hydrolase [Pedobacter sp.]